MSTNLEYRERERQRKRKNRRQASEGQPEKEQWRANLVPREKRLGDEVDGQQKWEIRSHFLLEEQHEFVAAVRKWEMPAAPKQKMIGSEKSEQEHVRHFLHKRVTSFLTFQVVVAQNNGKEITRKVVFC